ncbi:transcriptional regulator of sugar metabolism [Desulfosporosinus acidiphilus SJ4]|uniref:Transcriptional regulator of sugar metabolism n=1 Tax=Desulfosporosinus acidiphilus (strain DSM 22704 / JCM 16185 / SJ4) TaxID=646529 RepID=I4D7Q9_DESAJ|nr:DeoR/GlpR family DNA-binding transcription regulator [Desulfosporosinus acidiphilus]AFM41833.1 transcriptional regulator of sugar metabolism [Desulfosporosinus acidiphilus SJ4]
MSSERQDEIQWLLQEHGNLTVTELAKRFNVSEMTIRRDLRNLAALGLIQREHGRAIYPPVPTTDILMMSMGEAEREKARIGHLAATLISEGDSIFLDAGTTTLAVAQALTTKCTVITNSLPIASVLGNRNDITVLLTGGEVQSKNYALVGPITRSVIKGFNADKLFLGATGVTIERGLSTANMLESEAKQEMLKVAKEVILVAHSAKIGQIHFHSFASWDSIQTLVTDSGLEESVREKLNSMGVKVLLA